MKHANGVTVSSLPAKTALEGLDNAFIEFNRFRVPRDALLSRFASVSSDGEHTLSLPKGTKRMLDLLVARLAAQVSCWICCQSWVPNVSH